MAPTPISPPTSAFNPPSTFAPEAQIGLPAIIPVSAPAAAAAR